MVVPKLCPSNLKCSINSQGLSKMLRVFSVNDDLIVINVSEAEQSASGNGHAYFRKSPWVSSDILTTLRYDLAPADRGQP